MEYMGVGDAVIEWKVSRATVKRWCETGRAKAIKVSGRWLIDKDQEKPIRLREESK